MTQCWAARPITSRSASPGSARRPPSSPASRPTETATRWPPASPAMESISVSSCVTRGPRRSRSSCAAPRRPDRAIRSISTRPRSTARGLFRRLGQRKDATLSYDPNIRPLVTPDRDSVAELVERQASLAHVVKASEEDLQWLYPGRSIEESLAAWAKLGPRFCVATLGGRGALAVLGAERIEIPAPFVEVVDTVGAGDSFMSALLSAMDRDSALGAGATAPDRGSLERWLRFAAAASAITCTRKGSDPPTRPEVEAALEN